MAHIEATDQIKIKALQQQRQAVYDLMAAGPGTPWENRGSVGVFVGFFKTLFLSIFRLHRLTDYIRRPETSADATKFLLGCGIFWSIDALIYACYLIHYYRVHDQEYEIWTEQTFWTGVIFLMILAPVLLWLMTLLASRWFYKMIAFDMKSKGRPVLIYNCLAYSAGPSLFAIIPFYYIGPALALLWMAINWYIVGTRRLYVKADSVVIATVLVWLGVLIVFAGALVGAYFAWGFTIGSGGIRTAQ